MRHSYLDTVDDFSPLGLSVRPGLIEKVYSHDLEHNSTQNMQKLHHRTLFIFRQDLRTHDNTGLIEAVKNSKEIFPIFVYDDRAIDEFGEADPRF